MTYSLPASLPRHIFRAYDVRGIINTDLTPDVFYALGLAIGSQARTLGESRLVLGRDARLTSAELSRALGQGLCDSGCDVVDIGEVPTPLLYFATHHLKIPSGVMVTGSHNPADYNGAKIVLQNTTLAESAIIELYDRILQKNFSTGAGHYTQTDVAAAYCERVKNDIRIARPLKIVIDCGNGIAGNIAPALFRSLGCDCVELYCEVDGRFPNHHPDPSVPENLADLSARVRAEHADLGIAFDGDADRLGMVTNTGEIIWADRQMMLFARDILRQESGAVVFDIKCSSHLRDVITQSGGHPIMCQTGHSLVKARMRETRALLAGEMSGHLFFRHRWYGFDDGIYAAARLLEIIAAQQKSTDDLFAEFPNSPTTPEIKIPIDESKKFGFMDQFRKQARFQNAEVITIDGCRVEFSDGWGLVRVSNTSPNLTVRFEALTQSALARIQQQFREQLQSIDASLAITF